MSYKLGESMKKIILLLCGVLLLSGCTTGEDSDTMQGINFPKKGNYFCPEKNYDGSYILREDMFDASEKCEDYKSDFWMATSPESYDNCLKNKKKFVERFQLGTCSPVLKKTYNVKKSGCLFELATKYNKVVKYSCYGPSIPAVMRIIKAKYEVLPTVK